MIRIASPRLCQRQKIGRATPLFLPPALLVGVLLAGCAVPSPRTETITVHVPVAVPCIDAVPTRPALVTDAELRAMSDYQLPLALWRDRLMRQGYESELEATLTACAVR